MKKINKIRILAIETSCDETAAAVIHVTCNMKHVTNLEIKSNIISSQVKLHAKYGGVYPELASREHIRNILPVVAKCCEKLRTVANSYNFNATNPNQSQPIETIRSQVDYIAVTTGPGLIGSLLVGVNTAKTLAYALNKPIYAINHLEGHIYSTFGGEVANGCKRLQTVANSCNENVTNRNQSPTYAKASSFAQASVDRSAGRQPIETNRNLPNFPLVSLVVSGGHTSLVYMKNHFDYQVIGETLDDAAGEAFDKVAKLLGLGYPGGPAIAAEAAKVTKSYEKPRPTCQTRLHRLVKHCGQATVVAGGLITVTKSYQIKATDRNQSQPIVTNRNHLSFPRPMIDSDNFDFSFSGLKTSVLYTVKKLPESLNPKVKALICKEFQDAVVETLVAKTLRAAEKYGAKSVLLCGGVSANDELRRRFELGIMNHELWNKYTNQQVNKLTNQPRFFVPEKSLSTDNAAMIGIAAAYRIALCKKPTPWYDVNVDANLRLR